MRASYACRHYIGKYCLLLPTELARVTGNDLSMKVRAFCHTCSLLLLFSHLNSSKIKLITMGVPRGRRTKSKQGHRRSHLALSLRALATCPRCGTKGLPHRACANCGYYRGRSVIDVFKKLTKREQKTKEKELAAKEEETPK